MASVLEQLREMTVVVADGGGIDDIRRLKPQDCTTNPSLVLKALQTPDFADMLNSEIEAGRKAGADAAAVADALAIGVGAELTRIVPGYVSTEVDANLSFNVEAACAKARKLIRLYEEKGVARERILIKLASTWEGCQAARILEGEGIRCNMTLLFAMPQAVASAEAGAYLISPFVGRITDWHSAHEGGRKFDPEEDPGVLSVRRIYSYYKANDIPTIVMGASFRSTGQIKALAGCDRLTISPKFLAEMAAEEAPLERRLSPGTAAPEPRQTIDEATFRWQMNEDAMATDKLAEGIRNFEKDHRKLLQLVADKLG